MLRGAILASATLITALMSGVALAADYATPVPLMSGSQAPIDKINKPTGRPKVAYMPPATEFNLYIGMNEGIKSVAAKRGADEFMLAPQSGADINGQMGMIQDVLTQNVSAIIVGTHDEGAAAPLLKQAIDKGIAVIILNSDTPSFPTPVDGVVGYAQRKNTRLWADWVAKKLGNTDKTVKIGIVEGQPGSHNTERVGGFMEGLANHKNFEVVANVQGKWNVEGGNAAGQDLLQAHPEVQVIYCANDYMAIGVSFAAKAMGRNDILIMGNDGDTGALEEIAGGGVSATVSTQPYEMGVVAMNVAMDALDHKFSGGWVETPTDIIDKTNVIPLLQKPEVLVPKPSKSY